MNKITAPNSIYISESTIEAGGRGVFARTTISAGDCIEKCPVITLNPEDRGQLRKTELVNYYFLWRGVLDKVNISLCLGYGSVYNHSFEPNARYVHNADKDRMDFYALCDIQPNEEIFLNYNGDPDDKQPLGIPGIPGSTATSELPLPKRIIEGVRRRLRLALSWLSF